MVNSLYDVENRKVTRGLPEDADLDYIVRLPGMSIDRVHIDQDRNEVWLEVFRDYATEGEVSVYTYLAPDQAEMIGLLLIEVARAARLKE